MSRMDTKGPHEKKFDLMHNVAEGDFEAFEQLYAGLAPALSRFLAKRGAKPDLCEELIQKIFADLWEKRAHFRAQSSFKTYLFGVARNTLRRELRQSRGIAEKGSKNPPEWPRPLCNDLSEPEAEFYLKELQAAIEQALCKLSAGQRQAIEEVSGSNGPVRGGSAKADVPGPAQRNRLKRARKRLRELLSSILGDDDRNRP